MFEASGIAVFDQTSVGPWRRLFLAPLRIKLILFCHSYLLIGFNSTSLCQREETDVSPLEKGEV
jgi:hypothetical protein